MFCSIIDKSIKVCYIYQFKFCSFFQTTGELTMEKKISGEELVALLNGGGWEAVGGREMRNEGGFLPNEQVVKASVVAEKLSVTTDVRTFDLPSDNIVVVEEWLVEVRCSFMRRQQRKKVDGGGFVEVPAVGVALQLSNPELEKAAKAVRDAEAKKKEEERRQREEKAYAEKCAKFQEELAKKFVGRKLVSIEVQGGLLLRFEDGEKLFVELDGGDTYDAWIDVNGISLNTLEPAEDSM